MCGGGWWVVVEGLYAVPMQPIYTRPGKKKKVRVGALVLFSYSVPVRYKTKLELRRIENRGKREVGEQKRIVVVNVFSKLNLNSSA